MVMMNLMNAFAFEMQYDRVHLGCLHRAADHKWFDEYVTLMIKVALKSSDNN